MKKCFKCHVPKPLNDFYKHKQMGDGHLNKCKQCTKKDVAERYADPASRKRIREYERRRFQDPARKAKVQQYARNGAKANPEKARARRMVQYYKSIGKLTVKPCEECGSVNVQAHHEDYSKPLEVRWLCFKHHREAHGQKVG